MKKYYYLYAVVILSLIFTLPSITNAEQGTDDAAVNADVSAQAEVNTPSTSRPDLKIPTVIRNVLRAKTENIKDNEAIRNKILEGQKPSALVPRPGIRDDIRTLATSTKKEREDIREERREDADEIRREGRDDLKNASSSEERREIKKEMRIDIFKVRKEALVRQLNVALNNLRQIRDRISSRIDKAVTEGRNMTDAKNLLLVADGKITLAQQAIDSLVVFTPTASSTATTTVELGKPREVGEIAIKAVKKAHEALVAVVRAVAHAMGLGNNATSTPPVGTTTPTTTITPPPAPVENTSTVNPPVDNQ